MGLCCYTTYIYYGLGILAVYAAKEIFVRLRKQRTLDRWKDSPKDVLIVHAILGGRTVPTASPFALKLLTYLRMTNIPYKLDGKDFLGPKGRTPWITLNGQNVADSNFIIKFLNKKFEKNANGNYSEEQLALSKVVRIVLEEQVFWGGVIPRFVYGMDRFPEVMKLPVPLWIVKLFTGRKMSARARAQGMGNHTKDEVYETMSNSLTAISNLLGNKKFILGDEPCEDDCGIFGILAQCVWGSPGSPFQDAVHNGDFTNLKEYCIRMKERFWPDWEKCVVN